MSHFSVAVFVDDNTTVHELLAPYDENLVVPRYVLYTKEELIKKGRAEIEEFKNGPYARYLEDPEKYEKECEPECHILYLKDKFPKKLLWTDEEVYQDQIHFYDKKVIGPDGEVYSTYNPKSKWDWYVVGGRWQGSLLIKKTNRSISNSDIGIPGIGRTYKEAAFLAPKGYLWVDAARVRDIQWDKMKKLMISEAEKNWDKIKALPPIFKEKEMTKEEYIKNSSIFSTYAVITPDGEWHQKGDMGWWGISTNEDEAWDEKYKERFIDTANPDWVLYIVDCHI